MSHRQEEGVRLFKGPCAWPSQEVSAFQRTLPGEESFFLTTPGAVLRLQARDQSGTAVLSTVRASVSLRCHFNVPYYASYLAGLSSALMPHEFVLDSDLGRSLDLVQASHPAEKSCRYGATGDLLSVRCHRAIWYFNLASSLLQCTCDRAYLTGFLTPMLLSSSRRACLPW